MNFNFCEFFKFQFPGIFWKKKIRHTSYLENYSNLSAHFWKDDSQPVTLSSQYLPTQLRNLKFLNRFESKFSEILKEIIKIVRVLKLLGLEQSFLEARFTILRLFIQHSTT